jgi:citrate lyase beta subunit
VFIRVPLFNLTRQLDISFIKSFIDKGYRKFVLPKLNSLSDYDKLLANLNCANLEFIILIENPKIYYELQHRISDYTGNLIAIGLGSHDFMDYIGGVHNLQNLDVLRQNILYMARSSGIFAIDIASMQVHQSDHFESELRDGFEKGYDGKFIIHPSQMKIFNKFQFYTEKDYLFALKIQEKLKASGNKNEFEPVIIDGLIIERPHIDRAEKIIRTYKQNNENQ